MVSESRITNWIFVKLRASFVHIHRTAVKHRSVQCRNGAPGFRCLRHLHECNAAGFARIPVFEDRDALDRSVDSKQLSQLLFRHRYIQVPNKNVSQSVAMSILISIFRTLPIENETSKAISIDRLFEDTYSEWLYILSLPALGTFRNVELHGLTLLQALEPARLNRREVHKNIFATLAADKTISLRVVEPLYCSLFCHIDALVPLDGFTLERFGGTEGRLLACWARTAHDRFGLTHSSSYAPDAQLASRTGCAEATQGQWTETKVL